MTYSEYYEQWKKQKNGNNAQEVSTSQNSSTTSSYSDYYEQWKQQRKKNKEQEQAERAKQIAPLKNVVSRFSNMGQSASTGIKRGILNKVISPVKDLTNTGKNLVLGASSGLKQTINYTENATENNFSNYRNARKNQFYASNKVDELTKAQAKAKDSGMILKKAEQNMSEENKQNLEDLLNNKVETNLVKKSIQDSINKDNLKIQENAENTNSKIMKKINGEIVPSIGQMGVGTVISTINPLLGAEYFMTSAGGSYIDDAKQRGMNDKQSFKYGTIMGGIEGLTEELGIENFKKAGKAVKSLVGGGTKTAIKEVSKQGVKEALKNYGIGIADNVMQEAIIEPVQELTAQTIGGKDKANWDNMGQRMLESGINGGLVSAIVGGADVGVSSCVGLVEKINNGQQITQQEFKTAIEDASQVVDVSQMIVDSTQQQVSKFRDYNTGKILDNNTQNVLNQAENIINQNQPTAPVNNLANNNQSLYNISNLEETNNVPIDEVLSLQNSNGGYRDEQSMTNLREDIAQNGIKNPIELVRNKDGSIQIENGNHRLQIAKELGMKTVPVKFVESWDNIGKNIDISETSKLQGVENEYGRTNGNIEETNIPNAPIKDNKGNSSNYSNKFENRRTGTKNDNIPRGIQEYNNRPPSNSTYEKNINEQSKIVPIKETSNEASLKIPPINNTQGETVNWNEIERPEGKIRKHYKSIIESSNTTAEAKAIARELIGSDTYVPESNKQQLNEADRRIQTNGADNELNALTLMSNRIDAKITANDIAVGERLIEYYSKIGDKAKLQEAIQTTAMAGTQAGQTVQALSLLNHQTPQGQVTWIQRSVDKMNQELIKKRGENAPQFNFTSDMQQKIMEATTQEEMYKALDEVYEELGQQVSKSRLEQIDSWRYFSMLANPKTHIRNIVGNVAMGKLQSVKNKVAGAIEGTVAQFNPNMERTHTLKTASKEVKQFAKNDILNVADRLELNDNKYNPKSRLENSMRTFKSDAMENTLGKAFELNEKALEVEDAWGLKSGYVKALSEYMTANNLNPQTITDAQLAKARNYAIAEAKEATFHAENAIATAINQFSRKNRVTKGITDAVLPFVKTPMNVAKAGMEYNPTGLIKTLTYDTVQLRKGNISVNKYIDNLSKGLTGTGVAILGYAMAEAGILKASGGDDEKKEKFDEAIGKQSYSLEINGKTYSLDWLAPAGIPLFVGAEAHNINKAGKNEKTSKSTDDDKQSKQIIESMENWANAMTNSMSPMAEMSMISGLTSALKSYDQDSQKMLGTIGTNAVKSYVNQFVPTALGQVAKTADDYERSTTSTAKGILPKAIDQTKLQMMSKIPGLRQQLPIKTDVWGKEQKQEGNVVERGVKNAILPFNIKSVSNSKVDKALNELYGKTGAVSILPTTSLDKTFKIDGQTYRMTNEEYNKYRKSYGQNSYKLLDSLVSSNDYKNLNNEQKQKAIESVYSYAKEKNKVDYAKNNKIKVEPSTLYNTMEDLKKNGGNQSSYLQYIAKTTGTEKESERNKVLSEADYSSKTKSIIYSNGTGKDDNFYNIVAKNSDLDIDEYLNYKIQKNAKAFESDKDKDGKSISGSAKQKLYNWVNSNISGYENRLMILGYNYKLSNRERNDLTSYINKKSSNDEEAIETFKKLTSNYTYKNGKIYYK